MISSKGFLFTVSIILFATTLVTYTQVYSESVSNREFLIIENYKSKIVPFLMDDISTDILSILNLNFDIGFVEDEVNIIINGELPVENVNESFSDYKLFLETIYFPRSSGEKSIDFSNVFEDNFEVNFSTNNFVFDYNNSKVYLKKEFNLLDLNIFVIGSDLNTVESNFSSGDTPVSVNYFDDQNILNFSKNVNLDSVSYIKLVYEDNNILINIGLLDGNYFSLTSNIDSKVKYNLKITNFFDNNFFNANSNVLFNYTSEKLDVNSFVKIN